MCLILLIGFSVRRRSDLLHRPGLAGEQQLSRGSDGGRHARCELHDQVRTCSTRPDQLFSHNFLVLVFL